jgi:hypothetical protein
MRTILAIAETDCGVVLAARFFIAKKIRELCQCLKVKSRIHSGIKLP